MYKFVVLGSSNLYWFNLVAGNNEVVGTSEHYATKENCLKGIESVRLNSSSNAVKDLTEVRIQEHTTFEIIADNAGEFHFRLRAKNNQVILRSEGYISILSCRKGIFDLQKNAANAPVVSGFQVKSKKPLSG